jgi:hypothetical protein
VKDPGSTQIMRMTMPSARSKHFTDPVLSVLPTALISGQFVAGATSFFDVSSGESPLFSIGLADCAKQLDTRELKSAIIDKLRILIDILAASEMSHGFNDPNIDRLREKTES